MSRSRYAVVTPARNEEDNLAAPRARRWSPRPGRRSSGSSSTTARPTGRPELAAPSSAAEHPWIRLRCEAQREAGAGSQTGRRQGARSTASARRHRALGRAGRRRQGRCRRRLRAGLLRAAARALRRRPAARHRQRHLLRARGRRLGAPDEGRGHRLGRVPGLPLGLRAGRHGARAAHGLGRARRAAASSCAACAPSTFIDLPFRHHRPEGGRELTSLHQGAALGRASWYMGYRPSYLVLRAVYRARERAGRAGDDLGLRRRRALARSPRCPDAHIVRELRERQRLGVALRRGAPSS